MYYYYYYGSTDRTSDQQNSVNNNIQMDAILLNAFLRNKKLQAANRANEVSLVPIGIVSIHGSLLSR